MGIYEDILKAENTLSQELRGIVEKQKSELQKDRDKVNAFKTESKTTLEPVSVEGNGKTNNYSE